MSNALGIDGDRWRPNRGLVLTLLAASCTVPERPLPPAEVASRLAARAATPDELKTALDLADVAPLELELPRSGKIDPADAAFWHACAWAYGAEPRAARRKFLAAVAAEGGAGKPDSLNLRVDRPDLELTIDILRLFGLGPGAAERGLADAAVRHSLAHVEATLWHARYDVDQARVRLAASRALVAALAELQAEATQDRRRIDLLADRGWLGAQQAATARGLVDRVALHTSQARTVSGERATELSRASGLPIDAPSIAAVSAAMLDAFTDDSAAPSPPPPAETMLAHHPNLRSRRLDYALAEARLRLAAAHWWPDIELGPKLVFKPDDILVGGVLDLALPWPPSVQSAIDAAREEREAAGEAVEESLRQALAEVERRRAALVEARATLASHGPAVDAHSRAAWRGARARFRAEAEMLQHWNDALERRLEAIIAVVEARERRALAGLDYRHACGPEPRPPATERR